LSVLVFLSIKCYDFEIELKLEEKMEKDSFQVIGISMRTTNEAGQSAQDIGGMWHRFLAEGFMEKIPNKADGAIYSVYMEYEGDFMKPYTVVLGCRVTSLDEIPEGMRGIVVPGGQFKNFTAKGNLMEGAVNDAWKKIWETPLDRNYVADFEVYGEKAQNPNDAEVDIYVGVNQ